MLNLGKLGKTQVNLGKLRRNTYLNIYVKLFSIARKLKFLRSLCRFLLIIVKIADSPTFSEILQS